KKVEKEENKGIEEKDISGFSILAGTNGANINVKKNDTEIGINVDYDRDGNVHGGEGSVYHKGNGLGLGFNKEGEITKSNLKVHGVDYNLHLDLAMPGGALKFADDLKNVVGTPKAYINAINGTIEGKKLVKELKEVTEDKKEEEKGINEKNLEKDVTFKTQIRNTLGNLNVQTEKAYEYKLEREKAKLREKGKTLTGEDKKVNDAKIANLSKQWISHLVSLRGEEFNSIIFTRDPKFKGVAGTDENNNLIIHLDRIDIQDYGNLVKLTSYEANRWTYEDDEIDSKLALGDMQIKKGYTDLDLEVTNDIDYDGIRYHIHREEPTKLEIDKNKKIISKLLNINQKELDPHTAKELTYLLNEYRDLNEKIPINKLQLEYTRLKEDPNYKVSLVSKIIDISDVAIFAQILSYETDKKEIKKILFETNKKNNTKITYVDTVKSRTGSVVMILNTNRKIRGKDYYIILAKGTDLKNSRDLMANYNHLEFPMTMERFKDDYKEKYNLSEEEYQKHLTKSKETMINHQRDTLNIVKKFMKEKGDIIVSCYGYSKGGGECTRVNEELEGTQAIVFDPMIVREKYKNKEKDTLRDIIGFLPKRSGFNKIKDGYIYSRLFSDSIKIKGVQLDTNKGIVEVAEKIKNTPKEEGNIKANLKNTLLRTKYIFKKYYLPAHNSGSKINYKYNNEVINIESVK
ncbi:hypothetical protein, partial [Oceanivirga salmonicida]|uniref:hypothetical protein n=1 Tax=Oceanivirga salmonicida TaxID=1769291 RepID=UPI0018CC1E49